jgi:hypothetical protein
MSDEKDLKSDEKDLKSDARGMMSDEKDLKSDARGMMSLWKMRMIGGMATDDPSSLVGFGDPILVFVIGCRLVHLS